MRFLYVLTFLYLSLNSHAQEEEFYSKGKGIYDLAQDGNFQEANDLAFKFYHQYHDSSRALGLYLYTFGEVYFNLDAEIEDEDSLIALFLPYLDTVDLKFPGVDYLEEMVVHFLSKAYEIDILIPRLNKLIKNTGDPKYYALLMDTYNEDDEPEKADSVLSIVKEKSRSNNGFKRIMLNHYLYLQELDSAKVLSEEIMSSMDASADDFYNSALLNFLMKNKFQACEELRTAKRKGYSGALKEWEKRLNCFNEDRSNPVAIEFDRKHREVLLTENSPQKISREDWRPPFEKKYAYQSSEGDKLNLVSTRYYSNRGEKGFIYFTDKNSASHHDMKLRMLTIYLEKPWEDRKGDTLIYKQFNNILPVEFEKNHPIYIEKSIGEYQEVTYVGNEMIRLQSGEVVSCTKMRIAFLMDGFLKEVDYYWFAPNRGWIASEAMDGTRIEVLK